MMPNTYHNARSYFASEAFLTLKLIDKTFLVSDRYTFKKDAFVFRMLPSDFVTRHASRYGKLKKGTKHGKRHKNQQPGTSLYWLKEDPLKKEIFDSIVLKKASIVLRLNYQLNDVMASVNLKPN